MSKGSKPRPKSISEQEYALRWELIESSTTEERKLEILALLKELKESKK
jgi:hypothetical protein